MDKVASIDVFLAARRTTRRRSPMRGVIDIFVVVALLAPVLGRSEARTWEFITAVGGVAVGNPSHAGNGWTLPVDADVSGLHPFSSKPTTLNSGLICAQDNALVTGRKIYLTMETSMAGRGSARCRAASLGVVPTGVYEVFYRDQRGTLAHLRRVRIGFLL